MRGYWMVFLLGVFSSINAEVVVNVTVNDDKGEYIEGSIVSFSQEHGDALVENQYVAESGKVQLRLPNDELWFLTVSAPDYTPVEKTIFPKGVAEIDAEVLLSPVAYTEDPSSVLVVHSDADFDYADYLTMEKGEDGIFRLRHTTDSEVFKYFLSGASSEPSQINGQQQDSYEFDNDGFFLSVIEVEDGVVELSFDPGQGASETYEGTVSLTPALVQERTDALQELIDWENEWRTKQWEYKDETGTLEGFSIDETVVEARIEQLVAEGTDPVVRDIARMGFAYLYGLNKPLADQAINHFGLDNPMWSLNGGQAPSKIIFALGENEGEVSWEGKFFAGYEHYPTFFDGLLEESSVHNARKNLLLMAVYSHSMKKDLDAARSYLAQLKSDYPGDDLIGTATDFVGDNLSLKVGAEIPAFEFVDMRTSETISNAGLSDKIYLLDFWATWCSPCIIELPHLTDAYEKYADDGFEIVSLAMSDDRDKVEQFQEKKFKMPWKNVFVDDAQLKQVSDLFEVKGLPKVLMIDTNGKIIAMNADVKGDKLEQTIRDALNIN